MIKVESGKDWRYRCPELGIYNYELLSEYKDTSIKSRHYGDMPSMLEIINKEGQKFELEIFYEPESMPKYKVPVKLSKAKIIANRDGPLTLKLIFKPYINYYSIPYIP